ncbi:MAG: hypothetical protein KatS3mg008_2022 [Acidimicrobiales bacterium]|nr:MAG: hypothetical protein KatS3mg008_2022 [Acidimicrobiales bacterium]
MVSDRTGGLDEASPASGVPGFAATSAPRVSAGSVQMDDAALLRRCRRDPAAFRALYDRWSPKVLGWLQRRTGDAQASLDITAETFALVFERADTFRSEKGSVSSWIFGIANHLLARWFRSNRVQLRAVGRLGAQLPRWTPSDIQRVEELADSEGVRALVREALDACREEDRRVLELRVLQRLPYTEVASRLGCSQGAARVRCHRALERLERELRRRGVHAGAAPQEEVRI